MSENAFVVVFPSVFAKNKLNQLESNIKKILKIKNQKFSKIKRDDSVIVIEANDPVFASSAINLLFGIKKVAIAKRVKNDFDVIVSEITKIGSNLLLKGEKFYVQVEGTSKGFLTKDIEISATSSIIEKTIKIGAKPGSEEKYDKLLYTYLTKSNAYVCVYVDDGLDGIPNNSQNEKAICAIYDELSAVSCLKTIKQGFDVKIIVCYTQKSELTNFEELSAILAIYRPGPIAAKMDKIYVGGKFGNVTIEFGEEENKQYKHVKKWKGHENKIVDSILGKTYGAILYQEQLNQKLI